MLTEQSLGPKLYPTLILLVGDTSKALRDRLTRWLTSPIEGGFAVEAFDKLEDDAEQLWSQSRRLSSFGLATASEDLFVAVNDRTEVRFLLICETTRMDLLGDALQCCLRAEQIWKSEGRDNLTLNCKILLYGAATQDPVFRLQKLIDERFNHEMARPITFYLSDANGPIALPNHRALEDAVEIVTSILLLCDQSPAGATAQLWRQSVGAVFTIALREHWLGASYTQASSLVFRAAKNRLRKLLGGKSPSKTDLQSILERLVRAKYPDLMGELTSSNESRLSEAFERVLPTLLIDASVYTSSEQGLRVALDELAYIAEESTSLNSVKNESMISGRPNNFVERLIEFVRGVFRYFGHAQRRDGRLDVPASTESSVSAQPAISKFLRSFVGKLSEAPPPEAELNATGMVSPLIPCHEWRVSTFVVSQELEERLLLLAEDYLLSLSIDIPVLLAFNCLVGNSTLRDAVERARKIRFELQRTLRGEIHQEWIEDTFRAEVEATKSQRWKEHVYYTQISPAAEVRTLVFANNIALDKDNESSPVIVQSLLPQDRIYFVRFIKV